MAISYQSVAQECITLYATDGLKVGGVCSVIKNDTANPSLECDMFAGVVADIRGKFCSVIVRGFVTVPYMGDAPIVGWQRLTAGDNGLVQYDPSGSRYFVTNVNTTDKTVTFLL